MRSALRLFAKRGYDAVGVQEIVVTAKVTKPALYHYFGSKRGLIESLFEETIEQLIVALRQLRHPHPAAYQVIEAVVDVYFAFIRSKPAFYRLQLALYFAPQESEGYKAAGKYYVIQRALVIEILQAGQLALGRSAGEWQATTLIGLINCCASAHLNGEIKLTAKIRKDLTRQFLYGVTGKDQE
jgi:AcrR family transcriptional regulator